VALQGRDYLLRERQHADEKVAASGFLVRGKEDGLLLNSHLARREDTTGQSFILLRNLHRDSHPAIVLLIDNSKLGCGITS